jgi:hypothetical protein
MSSSLERIRDFYYLYTCKRQNRGSTGLRGEGLDLCERFRPEFLIFFAGAEGCAWPENFFL